MTDTRGMVGFNRKDCTLSVDIIRLSDTSLMRVPLIIGCTVDACA